MNYLKPELLEQLAAAYVVGTLRGRARARFTRLCEQQEVARAARARWEDRLMPLLSPVEPITPRKQVWQQIAKRIQGPERVTASGAWTPWWRWSMAGAVAMLLLVGIVVRVLNPATQNMAALGADAAHPLWQIARVADSSELVIHALVDVQSDPQKSYELWALPADGKPPVSLGLLPRNGKLKRSLTLAQRTALLNSNKVAVSLEPDGGSPTGAPTGPVLYVADIGKSG